MFVHHMIEYDVSSFLGPNFTVQSSGVHHERMSLIETSLSKTISWPTTLR